jgi:hypothetical protein
MRCSRASSVKITRSFYNYNGTFINTVIVILVVWTSLKSASPLRLYKFLFLQNFISNVRVTIFLQVDVELLVERMYSIYKINILEWHL